MISGGDPANTGASGMEVSGSVTEFISGTWQEQFDMICINQEVATIVVKGGIIYPVKVQVFLEF